MTYLTLDKKGRATLPEEVREAMGVQAGDFVLLNRTERGTYELVPAALVPKSDLWHLHPEFQERLRQSRDDVDGGRVHRTTGEEFLERLQGWTAESPPKKRRRR